MLARLNIRSEGDLNVCIFRGVGKGVGVLDLKDDVMVIPASVNQSRVT